MIIGEKGKRILKKMIHLWNSIKKKLKGCLHKLTQNKKEGDWARNVKLSGGLVFCKLFSFAVSR